MLSLYEYKAKIIKVYDGDTVTAEIDVGFKIKFVEKIRLLGINTPEIRGEEREEGIKSRDRLRELILDKDVLLRTKKDEKGKYGRYLGTIYLKENPDDVVYLDINKLLVKEGLAVYKDY